MGNEIGFVLARSVVYICPLYRPKPINAFPWLKDRSSFDLALQFKVPAPSRSNFSGFFYLIIFIYLSRIPKQNHLSH